MPPTKKEPTLRDILDEIKNLRADMEEHSSELWANNERLYESIYFIRNHNPNLPSSYNFPGRYITFRQGWDPATMSTDPDTFVRVIYR